MKKFLISDVAEIIITNKLSGDVVYKGKGVVENHYENERHTGITININELNDQYFQLLRSIKGNADKDYLLDMYNDYIRLYEMFGEEEYKKNAENVLELLNDNLS